MNAQLRKFLADAPDLYPHVLERTYPRIVESIASAWPSHRDARALFDQLLIDDRGNRRGFPTEVGLEIIRLSVFYAEHRAEPQAAHDVWKQIVGEHVRGGL